MKKRNKTIDIKGHKFIVLSGIETQIIGFNPDGSTYSYKGLISPRRKGEMTKIKAV